MVNIDRVFGIILAGGTGSRLMPLTKNRAKPGVPFGGNYRIIDFVMNSFINSGIKNIKVLTQFRSQSVKQHIERLYPSSPLYGHYIDTVPAQQKSGSDKWYQGTADAVYQNIDMLDSSDAEITAVFAGDHIFTIDVAQMLEFYDDRRADFVICAIPFPVEEAAGQLGVIEVDKDFRVIGFEEKPNKPKEIPGMPGMCFASMGNYLSKTTCLKGILLDDAKDSNSSHDFGHDIIPKMIKRGQRIFAYNFNDNKIKGQKKNYWRDVGTIKAYWEANMDLRNVTPKVNLFNMSNWPIRTFPNSLPPFKCGLSPELNNSLIGSGCVANGCQIFDSVLGQSIFIERRAKIVDSIIFSGCKIGAGADICKCIMDKDVIVPSDFRIGYSQAEDEARGFTVRDGITVIPKGFVIE